MINTAQYRSNHNITIAVSVAIIGILAALVMPVFVRLSWKYDQDKNE